MLQTLEILTLSALKKVRLLTQLTFSGPADYLPCKTLTVIYHPKELWNAVIDRIAQLRSVYRRLAQMAPHATDDYSFTFDNRIGGTPISTDEKEAYKVSEHILWAPRKVRVASIGAGAAGIMLCYKKEKEFGDDIDLVVYEREWVNFRRWMETETQDRLSGSRRCLACEPLPGLPLRCAIGRISVLVRAKE